MPQIDPTDTAKNLDRLESSMPRSGREITESGEVVNTADQLDVLRSSSYYAVESDSLTTATDYNVYAGLGNRLSEDGTVLNRGSVDITCQIKTSVDGDFGDSFTIKAGEFFPFEGLDVHTIKLSAASAASFIITAR